MPDQSSTPLQVVVNGAAGNVAYALLFRLAAGDVFGTDTPISLRLLDIEPSLPATQGTVMELEDGAFPLLREVSVTSDPKVAFDGASYVALLGALPRKQGQERGDLLKANGAIFKPLGQTLNEVAADDVRILVVGNPCNTNCYIAQRNAPDIPADRWYAMTRLDHNRAVAQLAIKSGTQVSDVTQLAIWGNHSATQYPDYANALIGGRSAPEVIGDETWLEGEFVSIVQKRGAAILEARGLSSAGSAAAAIVDSLRAIHAPDAGQWVSAAVVSRGEYGVPEGLVFSYPLQGDGRGSLAVVDGVEHGKAGQAKLKITTDELLEERDAVADLIPS